ncbi:MAG: hypothetical protein LBF84_04015, partial [Holosporales bacterium]|nr:hypothetical protein [Holosporales bacterium]
MKNWAKLAGITLLLACACQDATCAASRQHAQQRFTAAEDQQLRALAAHLPWAIIAQVQGRTTRVWETIAAQIPGKTARQCRLRWQRLHNAVQVPWTPEEDATLIAQRQRTGSSWDGIASYLPGRTADNVRYRWTNYLAQASEQQQVAPQVGPPLQPTLDPFPLPRKKLREELLVFHKYLQFHPPCPQHFHTRRP